MTVEHLSTDHSFFRMPEIDGIPFRVRYENRTIWAGYELMHVTRDVIQLALAKLLDLGVADAIGSRFTLGLSVNVWPAAIGYDRSRVASSVESSRDSVMVPVFDEFRMQKLSVVSDAREIQAAMGGKYEISQGITRLA